MAPSGSQIFVPITLYSCGDRAEDQNEVHASETMMMIEISTFLARKHYSPTQSWPVFPIERPQIRRPS